MIGVMPIAIRAAGAGDADTIAALGITIFVDTYAAGGVRPDVAREALQEHAPPAVARRLADAARCTLVVEDDGLVLGFAEWARGRPCPGAPALDTELVRLYVLRHAQRRGLGRALLRASESHAARAGAPALWLTAWDGNTNALDFYRHAGYAETGRTTFRFEDRTYENLVLVRPLGGPE
jgi:ribosomal protein S18 acetylase RimI-like enzyme